MSVPSLGLLLKGVAVVSSVSVFHGHTAGHEVGRWAGQPGTSVC